jgi:myo-inositol-1(or 4)-monophosphatase
MNSSFTLMREPIVNIAIEAARSGGNIINRALKRPDLIKIAEKSPNDFVTEVDQKVESEIIYHIKRSYPEHSILGEESGAIEGNDYQWVIDPIDGTRNFIHGFPHFAISIAILHKGKVEHGVIYDPNRQELFIATRGKGAQLNDRRIRVSTRKRLEDCLLGTGFAYRHTNKNHPLPPRILQTFLPACGDVRRAGAATLDLAYVACGRLDGFWEMGLKIWDTAAGTLMIKEAGGIVCDLDGSENFLKSGNVVAANPAIIKQMLKAIRPNLEE